MATSRTNAMLRQIHALFSLGRVGDRADGELLEWFEIHHAEAEAAFEELVVRHGAMVLDVCRRVLRDPNDVEDAFQATFLILVRRAGSIRNRDALGGWLHRVALRVALRAKSEAAHRHEFEQRTVAPETADPTEDSIERADMRTALHEELDRIPATYRAALVACYLEGLTHEEAANRLHWPVGTVRSRLARGRDRLRDRLARRGFSPALVLPVLAKRPELVPTCLRKLATQSMFSHVAGHALTGKVSAPVAALSEKVIRAMNLRTLKLIAAVVLTIGAVGGTLPFLPTLVPRHANAAQQPGHPGTLAGIVRDTEGKPVAGATVVVGAFTDQPNHQVGKTGDDGRFAFQGKEGERELTYVAVYKEGLAPATKFLSGGANGSPSDDTVMTLAKPEPFVGVVHDRNLKRIAGAKVRIQYMRGPKGQDDRNPIFENVLEGTPLESLFHTTTDKDGGFRFPATPPPHRVVLKVTADGMAELTTEVPGDYEAGYISGTAAQPAHLTMEPGARIKGRVVIGFPGPTIVGLKVALQSTSDSVRFWRTAKTDTAGRFEFAGLPEGGGNIFLIDHPNDGPWTYRAIDNLALHPGKTAEVTIKLIEGVLVEGKVVEATTGDPVEGVYIGMYGPARPNSGAAIMGATTDKKGQYRFRLPPGKTQLYTAGGPPWSYAGQNVEVPADVNTFTAPDLRVKKVTPAEPAPAPLPVKTSAKEQAPYREKFDFAGIVRDVSDDPIGGATVVAAVMDGAKKLDRQILTTGEDGRFSVTLVRPVPGGKNPALQVRFYAFKQGLAPVGATASKPDTALTFVLARTRPFACLVQDRDEKPIAGADAWVQSINAPVPEGQGMMVTEFSRPALEGTPIEAALRATSDEKGLIRFPSMPARSQVNLVVTAKGMRTHRTTDFTLPGMTGRWPRGFDAGFLHGNSDWPATLYLDPGTEAKVLQKGRNAEDALTKKGAG